MSESAVGVEFIYVQCERIGSKRGRVLVRTGGERKDLPVHVVNPVPYPLSLG